MDVREKLVELLCKVQDYGTKNTCEGWSVTVECKDNETVADHLIAHGVTVQERLVAKQVVIDKKYGSTRCPSCNAVLGASSHYCWQCGQKVTHKLPQPPKGE